MKPKRIALVAALLAAFALGGAAFSLAGARDRVTDFLFGPRLMRAEVVLTDGSDYLVDRGRITAVGGGSLSVTESDGRVVTVPIAAGTRVTLGGVAASQRALRRGLTALVVHTSAGPAVVIELARR